MNSKKILFFINSLTSGGAERVVSILVNELSKEYDVTIVLLQNIIKYQINKNVKIIIFDKAYHKNEIIRILFIPIDAYRFYKLNEKLKTTVSFSFLTKVNLINAFSKAFNPTYRIIISERTNQSAYINMLPKRKGIIQKFLIKNIYKFADIVNANSKHAIFDLKQNFGLKNTTSVIYNPTNKIEKSILTNELNLAEFENNFNIVCIANFREEKDHKTLLYGISKLKNKSIKVHLIGQEDYSGIEEQAINLQIQDKIKIWGYVKNPSTILAMCDCSILTSKFEGFPNTLLESIECLVPIIATNTSGANELLNIENTNKSNENNIIFTNLGLLIPIGDPLAVSKAIDFYYENVDFRNKIKENYTLYRTAFYVENIIPNYIKLINNLT